MQEESSGWCEMIWSVSDMTTLSWICDNSVPVIIVKNKHSVTCNQSGTWENVKSRWHRLTCYTHKGWAEPI